MRGKLTRIFVSLGRGAARLWWAMRQVFGDAAYENYLRSARAREETTQGGSASAPLSPKEFYLDSLRRRYSRISRCC
jgi:hypothetical protein